MLCNFPEGVEREKVENSIQALKGLSDLDALLNKNVKQI